MNNYYHDDHVVDGYRDFRSDHSQPPDLSKIYYIVFRVKTGNATWYHHTAQTVDGDLHSHILSLKCVLLASLNRSKATISCVLIRSLIPIDSSMIANADKQILVKERNAILGTATILSDEPTRFTVIGLVGSDKVVLFDIHGDDALAVNVEARKLCADKYREDFYLIEIMAVSPAMPSIFKMFQTRKPLLLAHVNTSFATDRHVAG